MPTVRLIPSTYYLSNTNYLSISNASNMYANTDSTNYATITNSRTSTTSYYLYIRGFNFNSVPSDAIVSSIAIKIKAYHSGGNTSTIGGYDGTTSVASAGTTTALSNSATVKTFTNTTINWNTLKSYGDDFGIRINCRRSSRNTTSYVYIYGAEIEVTYTVPVYHNVTASTTAGTIDPTGTQSILEGEEYNLTISGITPTVTDNGVDVTSQLVEGSSGTANYIPGSNTSSGFTVTNIANAYTDASSTTYATLDLGGGSSGTLYLNLEGASIPSTATIQSVTCSVTLAYRPNGSSSGYTGSCQLYSGTTSKGTSWTFASGSTSLSKTTHSMSVGTWSASDISNARLYVTATNNASSTHRYIDIYGVSFNVTYEVDGVFYIYTISSVTEDHTIVVTAAVVAQTLYRKTSATTWTTINYTKIYKKVNGVWVEQSDPSTAFDSNTTYVWSE